MNLNINVHRRFLANMLNHLSNYTVVIFRGYNGEATVSISDINYALHSREGCDVLESQYEVLDRLLELGFLNSDIELMWER